MHRDICSYSYSVICVSTLHRGDRRAGLCVDVLSSSPWRFGYICTYTVHMYLHTHCRSSLAKVPTSYSRRRSSSRAVHTHFALFLPLFYLLGDNRNEQREQEVCALASDSERISQRARVPKHLWLVAIPSTTLSLGSSSLSPLSKLLFLFTPRRTPKNALDSSVVYSCLSSV